MKKYVEYMDDRQVSDTLHQRLLNLEAPQKRAPAWNKYKGVAAVLAVALLTGPVLYATTRPEPLPPELEYENLEGADLGRPDIAIIENPGESLEPGMKTIGGYEVTDGEMAAYYPLPAIEYGMVDELAELAMDWDLPSGCTKRDLTQADFAALFGKEENLSCHLGWGGFELSGWAAWYEDGSLWGAFINGSRGEEHFEFAFTTGDMYPPTCIVYGEGMVNELWWDTPVTASGFDGPDSSSRRVELMKDGIGFRLDVTAGNADAAGSMAGRLVRYLCDGAFDQAGSSFLPSALTADGAVPVHPDEADPNYSVGEPNWEDGVSDYDSDCPYCADGTAHTHPYDPNESAATQSP